MLEFLMYKLEVILPEEEFKDIISSFSISKAQDWLDSVRDLVGIPCYEDIKEEFKASEEEKRIKLAEMNCFTKSRACNNRKTIFQIDIGADKHVDVDGKRIDDKFTGFFVGL